MNTEIIPRTTLTMLVAAWRESEAEIRQAFGLLVSAEKRLKETFKPDSYLFDLSRTDSRYRRYEDPDELLKELKKDVWRALIDRMDHYREQHIRAIDNVFHALDGNGTIKTHRGPLIDAIEAAKDGTGETDYFRFRCFRNRNLHLEFRRLDLVAKLNAVAGGMRLRGESKDRTGN